MPFTNIQYTQKIFDDPIYCESQKEQCPRIGGEYCSLTGAYLQRERGFRKKCRECAKLWKRQNDSKTPKTLPEGHRLDDRI